MRVTYEPGTPVAARDLIVWLRMRADCAHSTEIRDDLHEQAATIEWALDRYEANGGRLPRVERPSGRIASRFPVKAPVTTSAVKSSPRMKPPTKSTDAAEPTSGIKQRRCDCGQVCENKGDLLRHVHFEHHRVATRQELTPR